MVVELKIDLADDVAQQAEQSGLLKAPAIENMLRAELKRQRVTRLFAAADRLAAQESPALSEAEIAQEIQAARVQRREADAPRR